MRSGAVGAERDCVLHVRVNPDPQGRANRHRLNLDVLSFP